eukprot:1836613-Pyramimonas_sp.AAC.1
MAGPGLPFPVEEVTLEGKWPESDRLPLPPGSVIGSDGSGGEHSRDARLRRVGWSFVVCVGKEVKAAKRCSVAGPRQTVPRAGLLAVIRALQSTTGDAAVVVVVDASYITKGPTAVH